MKKKEDKNKKGYTHPVPLEHRQEFWNHKLNPITGHPVSKENNMDKYKENKIREHFTQNDED